MTREIIGIDVDDVVADHAAAFAEYSNVNHGTNISRDTYTERWDVLWNVYDRAEIERRAAEFHTPESAANYVVIDGAQEALETLTKTYTLAVVTARPKEIVGATHDWLETHFKGVFSEVHFVPIWHPDNTLTKADICRKIKADYLIDDLVKHCNIAAQAGIKALLFGDYLWNRSDKVDDTVTRCKDWAAVLEYFDA